MREDPDRAGLLYAGTERGMYVSFDGGGRWQSLQLNLPIVPVTDLRVHRRDLVVSTQGRSFWILDDLSPLHELAAGGIAAPHLFLPREAMRAAMEVVRPSRRALAENPPYGAIFYYSLPAAVTGEVALEITGPDGKRVQRFSSEHDAEPNPPEVFVMTAQQKGDQRLTKQPGLNRFAWDLRYPVVNVVPDAIVWGFTGGPAAVPGEYRATLTVGGVSQSRTFRILPDPRLRLTAEDYAGQLALMFAIRQALDDAYDGVRTARSVREQARGVVLRMQEAGANASALGPAAESLAGKLTDIENELMQTKNEADQDVENFPTKIDNQLAYVYGLLGEVDAKPTAGQIERVRDLRGELDAVLARLRRVLEEDSAAFNAAAKAAGASPILVPK